MRCHYSKTVNNSICRLRVGVRETLLQLAFGLDTRILHVLEVLRHILHLVLELLKVLIFTTFLLNHIYTYIKSIIIIN
jgi:hypothetical protein